MEKSYNELEVCLGEDIHKAKWATLQAPQTPNIYQRFIRDIKTGKHGEPDFARGAEIQKALDACFESDRIGQAVKLNLPGSDVPARTRVRKPKNAVP